DRLDTRLVVLDGELGGGGVPVRALGAADRRGVDEAGAGPLDAEGGAGPGLDARLAVVVPGAGLGHVDLDDVVTVGDALAGARLVDVHPVPRVGGNAVAARAAGQVVVLQDGAQGLALGAVGVGGEDLPVHRPGLVLE